MSNQNLPQGLLQLKQRLTQHKQKRRLATQDIAQCQHEHNLLQLAMNRLNEREKKAFDSFSTEDRLVKSIEQDMIQIAKDQQKVYNEILCDSHATVLRECLLNRDEILVKMEAEEVHDSKTMGDFIVRLSDQGLLVPSSGGSAQTTVAEQQGETKTSTSEGETKEATHMATTVANDHAVNEGCPICSICLDILEDPKRNIRAVTLSCPCTRNSDCTHTFHSMCLSVLIDREEKDSKCPLCPLCRAKISSDDKDRIRNVFKQVQQERKESKKKKKQEKRETRTERERK